jgi:DNA-directed RNA polymerase II subunit RPB1
MDTNTYNNDIDSISQIDRVEFTVLGNAEISKISALGEDSNGIEIVELYDNSEPKRGGLIDSRMGTNSHDFLCATCGLNMDCPGHSAHINLAEYVFHIGYLQTVQKILSCVCFTCSKLLIHKNENDIKDIVRTKTPKERLNHIKNATKNVQYCQKTNYGCGTQKPKIKIDANKKGTIYMTAEMELKGENDGEIGQSGEFIKTKTKIQLNAEMVHEILKNISDDDCRIMGLDPNKSRPEDLIHKVLYVPPVQMRPSTRGDFMGGMGGEDDLTHKLADIVRHNLRIIKNKENQTEMNTKYHADYANLLQYHVATYMENETTLMPKAEQKGRAIKAVASRLKGKSGRIRGNLMGKRGDFTARTVITSDPSIRNNQLRVPVAIAMNLTFPEVVGPDNIEHLKSLVKRGRDQYPGANYVFELSKHVPGKRIKQIDLRYRKEGTELHYGDIVERHLLTNDVVLLNRQPTLHKQSMMAFRIKVVNDPNLMTFGMSVDVTDSFNADFDGDEMNIFVSQTIQTQVELEEIACVEKQIISPSTSKTANGTKQDGLVGGYNLSSPTLKVDWRTAMNLITYTTLEDFSVIKKGKDISGIKMYSVIIPPNISVSSEGLVIKNGKIIEGRITADALGAKKANTIVQTIWEEYGADLTENFIDNNRWLANNFNLWHGFSVGYGDIEIDPKIVKAIDNMFETKMREIEHLVTETENNPELMRKDLLEQKMYSMLKIINEEGQKLVANNLSETNAFRIMHLSGSKGSASNVGQMMGCMGLQAFEGKLMPKKYNKRTLPYYHQNDDTAESRGLVRPSFYDGLEWPHFIYQMVNGRSGLIDSAVKTAETGYMQRKLVKSFEDIMVCHDGTVRNANKNIIQYVYGDAGSDPVSQFRYNLKILDMNNDELEKNHKFTDKELKNVSNFNSDDNDRLFNSIKLLRDKIRICVRNAKADFISKINTFVIPVNINRLIEICENHDNNNNKSKLDPKYIIDKINEILTNEKTPLVYMTNDERKNKNSLKYKDDLINKTVFKTALLDAFSPKKILLQYNLDKEKFNEIMDLISYQFEKNMVEPGEMVGVIAATSTGEPLTQMTLKSFHQAGVARKSLNNMGVPRMKEIFSVSKNPRAPEMRIYLKENIRDKKEAVHKISSNLKYISFGEIRERITTYYDPNANFNSGITKKDGILPIQIANKGSKTGCQTDINNLPWLLRIEINREQMAEKEIKLLDIVSQFCIWWDSRIIDASNIKKDEKKVMNKITQLTALNNSDNSKEQIIHIRFNCKDNDKDKFDLNTIADFITYVLDRFKLKGINGIAEINAVPEEKINIYDKNTGELLKDKTEYVIYTSGVNLLDIRYLEGIDLNKTLANDIAEIYNTFGIEIARSVLMNEIAGAYKDAGGEVNFQHIEIIVDQMCMTGAITSIDRYGLNKSDADPFARASFEKPVEQLWNSAVFGEVDKMNSVSSRIMAGNCIRGGTGYSELLFDNEMLEKSEYIESEYDKKFNVIKAENVSADILQNKNISDENIFMPM